MNYPEALRVDLTDDLHGRHVPDPYRWLENPEDPRTQEWSRQQDVLAREWLDTLPGRQHLDTELRALLRSGSVGVPVWKGGRAFFTRREPDGEFPVLWLRERDGTERVLLDVAALDPSGRTTLDRWSPSPDGARLAYQISTGGDEESLLHVLDVATGDVIEGPIDRCRYSSVAWLPGGDEYFYVRRLPPEHVPDGEEQFHRRVWRHRVGDDPETDDLVHGDGLHHTYFFDVAVSEDGRWLVVHGCPGTARRDSVWIGTITHGQRVPALQQFVDAERDGVRCTAWVERDERLYVMTTDGAPRWRLCVTTPERPERENWTELIGQDPDSVLDAVEWLPNGPNGSPLLATLRTRHAVSEIALHDPRSGARVTDVPLPGTGQITGLASTDPGTTGSADTLWIGWTDFATPPCVHTFSATTGHTSLAERAPGAVDIPPVHTRQISYRSADGTTVRMFVLSPTGEPDRPRPALLTGYGGFALSREPGYAATALAWVASGGVWALASLRGGSEEGEEWHVAGMRENKQNVFDDFHAAAKTLAEQGWTTAEQLAITGGSNGGLLVGAALTQRPELYRAVVCSAPLLDMVRYEKFLLGRLWSEEYGSAEVAEELDWLLSYSPYHAAVSGHGPVDYPSVLFTVFDSDTRVDPHHARKMCAALQHATTDTAAKHPILLRRETEVGHSARSVSRTVGLAVDQLAFLAEATGLVLG